MANVGTARSNATGGWFIDLRNYACFRNTANAALDHPAREASHFKMTLPYFFSETITKTSSNLDFSSGQRRMPSYIKLST